MLIQHNQRILSMSIHAFCIGEQNTEGEEQICSFSIKIKDFVNVNSCIAFIEQKTEGEEQTCSLSILIKCSVSVNSCISFIEEQDMEEEVGIYSACFKSILSMSIQAYYS